MTLTRWNENNGRGKRKGESRPGGGGARVRSPEETGQSSEALGLGLSPSLPLSWEVGLCLCLGLTGILTHKLLRTGPGWPHGEEGQISFCLWSKVWNPLWSWGLRANPEREQCPPTPPKKKHLCAACTAMEGWGRGERRGHHSGLSPHSQQELFQ